MDMPEQMKNIKADLLCEILGVENLHIIESTDGKSSPSNSNDDIDLGLIFRAILIIGMIILGFVLGT